VLALLKLLEGLPGGAKRFENLQWKVTTDVA